MILRFQYEGRQLVVSMRYKFSLIFAMVHNEPHILTGSNASVQNTQYHLL